LTGLVLLARIDRCPKTGSDRHLISRKNPTTMPMQQQLTIRAILTVALTTAAHAQSRIDRLQPLVAVSAKRLAIAERVALAKWDRGTAVEDANREAQVVRAAVASAKEKGLSQQFISTWFSAQIEANKLVQYSLLGEWRRRGRAPEHKPIDLGYVRQELDQLQEQLIQALADTGRSRDATCQADVAKAVGRYVARRPRYSPASAVALDRAFATFCTPE